MKIDYSSVLNGAKKHRAALVAYDHAVKVLEVSREAEGVLAESKAETARLAAEKTALIDEVNELTRIRDRSKVDQARELKEAGGQLAKVKANKTAREAALNANIKALDAVFEKKKSDLQADYDERKVWLDVELKLAERVTREAKTSAERLTKVLSGEEGSENAVAEGDE